MRHLGGEEVGGILPESSREELDEKRRPKRLAFSVGVLAIDPSGRIRGGKADLQKLLEMFLVNYQKFLSVEELSRPSHFRFMKVLLV